MPKVKVRFEDQTIEVEAGTKISQIIENHGEKEKRYLGATLNHHLVHLNSRVWNHATIRLLTVNDAHGAQIYRRSATYLLFAAFKRLYPESTLTIGQSMGNGYHFQVIEGDPEIDLSALEREMHVLVDKDLPFERRLMRLDDAIALFEERQARDRVQLLRIWPSEELSIVKLDDFIDILHAPVAPSAGCLKNFKLIPQSPGFILHFFKKDSPFWHDATTPSVKLFETYQETRRMNDILGVNTVGELNELCLNGGVRDLIHVSEGFHEKKIAQIADQIASRQDVRIVLIAGPTSSGKTTFSKRLSTQLKVNGIEPVTISLDDYYVNRVDTPKLPDGRYDFESIEALDLALFNQHLEALLDGQEVMTPRYDFHKGERTDPSQWRPLQLKKHQVLMLEGIHGLNDRLTQVIPASFKFKIYVSALTQLVIDHANRIATSDARLIRRIVRDRRYRGYSAAQTIEGWPIVRAGERRNLFPFQDSCDVMFNSSLIYEPAVLKVLAERYLLEIPRDHPQAPTAHILRKFLQFFVPIFPNDVPQNSIIREFIGGSAFKY